MDTFIATEQNAQRKATKMPESTLPPAAARLARATPTFKCPQCGEFNTEVVRTMPDNQGEMFARIRACMWCRHRFRTEERITARKHA
jgi:DNA-directed RNA polymerase subunit M/transcription elongation factor TFIIS